MKVFKEDSIGRLILSVFIVFWGLLFYYALTQVFGINESTFSHPLVYIFLFIITSLLIILVNLLTFTRVFIEEEGLIIRSKLSVRKISWENIKSMTLLVGGIFFYGTRYQLKINYGKTVDIPVVENREMFEKLIEQKADLEFKSASVPLLYLFGPNRGKRWVKRGEKYEPGSLEDKIMGYLHFKGIAPLLPFVLIFLAILIGLMIYQIS